MEERGVRMQRIKLGRRGTAIRRITGTEGEWMGDNGMRFGAWLSILTSNQFTSASMRLFETIIAFWFAKSGRTQIILLSQYLWMRLAADRGESLAIPVNTRLPPRKWWLDEVSDRLSAYLACNFTGVAEDMSHLKRPEFSLSVDQQIVIKHKKIPSWSVDQLRKKYFVVESDSQLFWRGAEALLPAFAHGNELLY